VNQPLILARGSLGPVPFEERIRAAVAGGFDAIGLAVWEYQRLLGEGYCDAVLQRLLAASGIRLLELEAILGFDAPAHQRSRHAAPGRPNTDPETERMLFQMADLFGARHLQAIGTAGVEVPEDDAAEAFARLCDRAAEHGLLVALEFVPTTSVPDAGAATRVVQKSGRPNAGLCLDSWHHFRGRNDVELLRSVPADQVWVVQLDDGPLRPAHRDFVWDTTRHRQVPGTGEFDLTSYLRILWEAGVSAPVSVEVMSETPVSPDPAEVGRVLGQATRAVLRVARLGPGSAGPNSLSR
jgi:sugar phosphate isomerase/epimerase